MSSQAFSNNSARLLGHTYPGPGWRDANRESFQTTLNVEIEMEILAPPPIESVVTVEQLEPENINDDHRRSALGPEPCKDAPTVTFSLSTTNAQDQDFTDLVISSEEAGTSV